MSETQRVLWLERSSESFADFYRHEVGGQVRRAALLVGSADMANDLVHDAFVEIYRRWDVIEQPGPYLNRAVLNRCRDAGRHQRRHRQLLPRLVAVNGQPWPEDSIGDVLDVLPFNQRAAVVLRFYVGMTNAEIAVAMHCPPGSVGPWINRALKHLREALT
jgi:DNA-directed RNA polymerase specialized sigma24 family protein